MIKSLLKILSVLSPGIFIGALIGIYPGYKVYEYTWKSSNFCLQCHVHDYANVGWHKSIHGQVTTCHDCHHQPLRAYLKETYIMLTHKPTFPQDLHHTPYVPGNLCSACHVSKNQDHSTLTGPMSEDDIAQIPKVDHSHLHKIHLEGKTDFTLLNSHALTEKERVERPDPPKELSREKGELRSIECADCHGGPTNRGHNFGAVDISCVRCHEQAHRSKVLQEQGCRTCHFADFLAPVRAKAPKAK